MPETSASRAQELPARIAHGFPESQAWRQPSLQLNWQRRYDVRNTSTTKFGLACSQIKASFQAVLAAWERLPTNTARATIDGLQACIDLFWTWCTVSGMDLESAGPGRLVPGLDERSLNNRFLMDALVDLGRLLDLVYADVQEELGNDRTPRTVEAATNVPALDLEELESTFGLIEVYVSPGAADADSEPESNVHIANRTDQVAPGGKAEVGSLLHLISAQLSHIIRLHNLISASPQADIEAAEVPHDSLWADDRDAAYLDEHFPTASAILRERLYRANQTRRIQVRQRRKRLERTSEQTELVTASGCSNNEELSQQRFCCTYDECATPDTLYDTKEQWIRHEVSCHLEEYQCPDIVHSPLRNKAYFETHLKQEHAKEYTSAPTWLLLDMCRRPCSEPCLPCSLCSAGGALNLDLAEYESHVAAHLSKYADMACDQEASLAQDDSTLAINRSINRSINCSINRSRRIARLKGFQDLNDQLTLGPGVDAPIFDTFLGVHDIEHSFLASLGLSAVELDALLKKEPSILRLRERSREGIRHTIDDNPSSSARVGGLRQQNERGRSQLEEHRDPPREHCPRFAIIESDEPFVTGTRDVVQQKKQKPSIRDRSPRSRRRDR